MKALLQAIALLAVVACTPQQQSPQGTLSQHWLGAGSPGPAQIAGSPDNTATAFDGTYRGISESSHSATGSGLKSRDTPAPRCQQFEVPPTVTITNGLAEFQAMDVTFAGYVTPQGHLKMDTGYGSTINADFDPRTPGILHGQAVSVNCRYNVTWQKTA
jgi:hypothetical protein